MGTKASILKMLPGAVQQSVRKIHYLKVLKYFRKTPELIFLNSLVKQGDTAVDIGANVGVYTKCLSELVGLEGHVFSIEPIPSTFDILSFNKQKLKLDNVKLFNCAASDSNGEVGMFVPAYPNGGDNFYEAGIAGKDDESKKIIKVKSYTLDSLLCDCRSKINFVKIDVEGHELKVLNGAENTIKKFTPIMLIEIKNDPEDRKSDAFQIFNLLGKMGYHAFILGGEKFKKYYPGVRSINYFFLPNK